MKFCIFDVSNCLYAGSDATSMGLLVGGLSHLNAMIARELARGSYVVLALDSTSFRKELCPTYKGSRVPKYDIYAQAHLVEMFWGKCGVPALKVEGLEADDIIFSLATKCEEFYYFDEIAIYSADKDLSCNITQRCTMYPPSEKGSYIDRYGYSDAVVRGKEIEWNTVLLYKLVHGDFSDEIAALKNKDVVYEEIAAAWIGAFGGREDLMSKCMARLDLFTLWIKESKYSDDTKKAILEQAQLVFPRYHNLLLDENKVPFGNLNTLNKRELQRFLTITKSDAALKLLKLQTSATQEDYQVLKELSDSLVSGKFIVDKRLPMQPIGRKEGNTIFLGEF